MNQTRPMFGRYSSMSLDRLTQAPPRNDDGFADEGPGGRGRQTPCVTSCSSGPGNDGSSSSPSLPSASWGGGGASDGGFPWGVPLPGSRQWRELGTAASRPVRAITTERSACTRKPQRPQPHAMWSVVRQNKPRPAGGGEALEREGRPRWCVGYVGRRLPGPGPLNCR